MFFFNRIIFEGESIEAGGGFPRKGYKILWMDEKTKINNKIAFHLAKEFYTLSHWLFFEDAYKSVGSISVQLAIINLMKK